MMLREWLLALPRRYKRLLQVFTDIFLVWFSLWMAFVVRLGVEHAVDPFGAPQLALYCYAYHCYSNICSFWSVPCGDALCR